MNKSVEETYHQKNQEVMLKRAKGYYQNNKERLREQAWHKYRNLSEEEKNKKKEYAKIYIIVCLKNRNKD